MKLFDDHYIGQGNDLTSEDNMSKEAGMQVRRYAHKLAVCSCCLTGGCILEMYRGSEVRWDYVPCGLTHHFLQK
jgi:hypothetical protein